MAVVVHVTLRGVTPAQYDAVRERAGWIEQPPAGGISHTTWWEGDDCHNLDAWESEEAFAAFAERRLAPAMAASGVTSQPETTVHAAHEVYTPHAGIVAPTAKPTVGAVDNAALIRTGYDAFARGDVETVLSLFDRAITWYTPDTIPFGGRYEGPAAVGGFFSKLPENYAELHVEPTRFIDRADTVVAIGRHRGRSAAGIAFENPFVHVWTFSNGKATSFTEYFDTVKMNAALGLVAQSGAPQGVAQHV
ncbi:MAG: nuclear transport factor 2 family protein [Actinomycetes bacterium]